MIGDKSAINVAPDPPVIRVLMLAEKGEDIVENRMPLIVES